MRRAVLQKPYKARSCTTRAGIRTVGATGRVLFPAFMERSSDQGYKLRRRGSRDIVVQLYWVHIITFPVRLNTRLRILWVLCAAVLFFVADARQLRKGRSWASTCDATLRGGPKDPHLAELPKRAAYVLFRLVTEISFLSFLTYHFTSEQIPFTQPEEHRTT